MSKYLLAVTAFCLIGASALVARCPYASHEEEHEERPEYVEEEE